MCTWGGIYSFNTLNKQCPLQGVFIIFFRIIVLKINIQLNDFE